MNKTNIEWVKNPDGSQGYTWNPITGCLNHVNGMCKGGNFPCYAYRLAHGRLRSKYLSNTGIEIMNPRGVNEPFYPRFWPERIPKDYWLPLRGGTVGIRVKSKGIFVCDMGDLFGSWVPIEWQEEVFKTIRGSPDHRFYLLTKQPQNLIKWSPFPDNCWVGVTATNTRAMVDAMNALYHVKATVKYLSLEPLLEWNVEADVMANNLQAQQLDWLIIGAQTKPTVYPRIEWMREIVEAADQVGVPVFLKDNLMDLELPLSVKYKSLLHGCKRLRQEMPE